jgi:hypothetical protein
MAVMFSTGCESEQDKEIEALVKQYFQYWNQRDEEGMKSLLTQSPYDVFYKGGELFKYISRDDVEYMEVKEVKDITPRHDELPEYLQPVYPEGLSCRYDITIGDIKSEEDKLNFDHTITIYFLRETESSEWKILKFLPR